MQKFIDFYPEGRQKSAILACLYIIQREHGYCPVDAQNELADILGIEPAEVGGVVGYYHMILEEPKAEFHLEVCTNVPCMLRGANKCMHHIEEKLGISHGEQTTDGQFALDHMECLGSCGVSVTEQKSGQIRYFEELDSDEDVDQFLDLLKNGNGFKDLERWTPEGDPNNEGKAAGPYTLGGMETLYLMGQVDKADSHRIDTYEADGGYETARRVLTQRCRSPRTRRCWLPYWHEMEFLTSRFLPPLSGSQC